ncbi:Uncharacterised protein [Mycobacteroides abscessus subsp. abscessus]|nr:Uncharacterised protein [Mycobacteroides abscessus subsp. abscessus]
MFSALPPPIEVVAKTPAVAGGALMAGQPLYDAAAR